jgi:deoxyribodipyrimidine photo-lyase
MTFLKEHGKDCTFIKELIWRDFFTYIAYHFPHVFKGAFYKKYDLLKWENNKKKFLLWCNGKTGFPIVDAGMRELNETGYMHNRVRMIVASFLVKDLHISWQWGERYFANHLIDYDPSVNNGNWQWCASTGCDAQPYFRIFNPWLQQKKFDKDCIYIKKWIPELEEVDNKIIHEVYKHSVDNYPAPCVDHSIESKKTISFFKIISKQ